MQKQAIILLMVLSMVCTACSDKMDEADTILFNGRIITVDKDFSITEAVAISGDKIMAVGSDTQILKSAGVHTQKIDLQGKKKKANGSSIPNFSRQGSGKCASPQKMSLTKLHRTIPSS